MEYRVKVISGTRREGVRELSDGRLEVSVRPKREKGEANARMRELLAEYFHEPITSVTIRRGHTSATKTISVRRK